MPSAFDEPNPCRDRRRIAHLLPALSATLLAALCLAGPRAAVAAGTSPDEESVFAPAQIDYPAPDPLLGLVDARSMTSLNGEWRMIVDPMGVGDPGSFFGGFAQNRRPVTGMELIEYDLEASPPIRVPGDFNTQDQ